MVYVAVDLSDGLKAVAGFVSTDWTLLSLDTLNGGADEDTNVLVCVLTGVRDEDSNGKKDKTVEAALGSNKDVDADDDNVDDVDDGVEEYFGGSIDVGCDACVNDREVNVVEEVVDACGIVGAGVDGIGTDNDGLSCVLDCTLPFDVSSPTAVLVTSELIGA